MKATPFALAGVFAASLLIPTLASSQSYPSSGNGSGAPATNVASTAAVPVAALTGALTPATAAGSVGTPGLASAWFAAVTAAAYERGPWNLGAMRRAAVSPRRAQLAPRR